MMDLRSFIRQGLWLQIFISVLLAGILMQLAAAVVEGSVVWISFWTLLGVINTKNLIQVHRNRRGLQKILAWFEAQERKR